jgi:hypothetical protein
MRRVCRGRERGTSSKKKRTRPAGSPEDQLIYSSVLNLLQGRGLRITVLRVCVCPCAWRACETQQRRLLTAAAEVLGGIA